MKTRLCLPLLILTAFLFAGFNVTAQAPASDKKPAKPKRRVRYVPPVKGAPKVRVGGGVRGEDMTKLEIDVIAPDHVSLTASAQPTLYWRQSFDGKDKPIQVTVLRPRKAKPVMKVTLEQTKKGINSVCLSDHSAKLEPNVDYQWVVSYVSDKKGRWKDVLAGAMIRHTPPDDKIAGLLKGEMTLDTVYALLEKGVWYDGWAGLMTLQQKNPADPALTEVRNDLISQIGLKENTTEK